MLLQSINEFISRYHDEHQTESENAALAKQVLEAINTTHCPPSPIHYSVIYESIVNIDPEMGNQIAKALENKLYSQDYGEEAFRTLILKYLFTHLPSQQIEELLQGLLEQMDLWFAHTQKEQLCLQNSVENMHLEDIPQHVKQTIENEILPAIANLLTHTNEFKEEALGANAEIKTLKTQLAQANEIAKTDELTKLPNRRAFNETSQQMLSTAAEQQSVFSMLLVDIDFFKFINDEYGHLIGDSVLRYLAKLLTKETKGKDFVARYGGEEFIVLLPNTPYKNALSVAENLRQKVENTILKVKNDGKDLQLSISCGVSTLTEGDSIDSLFERADKALYSAKNSGRNQVKGEQDLLT